MTRIFTPALVSIGLLTAAITVWTRPAAADHDQDDEAIAHGLTGLVASFTGYTTPTDAEITCILDGIGLSCGSPNRTAALDTATNMVASSVDMMAEG